MKRRDASLIGWRAVLALGVAACGSDPEPIQCADEDPGPLTVEPVLVGRGNFAMDPLEVSVTRYRAFLEVMRDDTSGQPPECAWNDSFDPDRACLREDAESFESCGKLPQVCVDWCDARAFCEWDGKRLCGDPDGGPEVYDTTPHIFSREEAEKSEWMFACSAGGVNVLLFGESVYDEFPPRCHLGRCTDTGGYGCRDPEEVDSRPECHSPARGYTEFLNLVGNVNEWVDSCDGTRGAEDDCSTRGGSTLSGNSQCDWAGRGIRSSTSFDTGIRCCADL